MNLSRAHQLNARLWERLGSCRLVFEILDSETIEEVQATVDELYDGGVNLPRALSTELRAVLACHLVAQAIDCYTAGSFWPNFDIETIPTEQAQLGAAFIRTLRDRGLETFEGVGQHTYLTPILAHAGMPSYCLQDFFFRLLIPELRKRPGSSAPELLANWRTRKTAFAGIDRPVERFLLFGGATAVDLLDRCIDLLSETARTTAVPDAASLGLPQHVVGAFRKGWLAGGHQASIAAAASRSAVPSPQVRLDPWDPLGPVMELPALPSSYAHETWKVENGGLAEEVPVSILRSQQRRLLPSRDWSATLTRATEPARVYSFERLPATGVAVFDAATGLLTRDSRQIPCERVWLLCPQDTELSGRGKGGEHVPLDGGVDLPRPVGAWTGFRLLEVAVDGLASVVSSRGSGSGQRVEESIRVTWAVGGRPRLEGRPLERVRTETGLPVFAQPPELRLPHEGFAVSAWRVRLRVNNVEHNVEVGSPSVQLGPALAEAPVAEVRVLATGPIGSDLRTDFAVVRGLEVAGPSGLVLPKEPVTLRARVPAGVRANGIASGTEINLGAGQDTASFVVAAEGSELRLRATVPRLVWAITKPGAEAAQHFEAEVQRVSLDELGRGADWGGAVCVSTRVPGTRLRLELTSPDGTCLQKSGVETASPGEGRVLFSLAPFRDTATAHGAAALRLDLWVVDRPAREQVGVLFARVCLKSLQVAHIPMPDGPHAFSVELVETVHFRRRELRFWSLSRPWEDTPALSLDMPDDLLTSGVLFEPAGGGLPSGKYLAEVAIRDDWGVPERPSRSSPSTSVVAVGDPFARWAELKHAAERDPVAAIELLLDSGALVRPLSEEDVRACGDELIVAAASLEDGRPGDDTVREQVQRLLRAQPTVAATALSRVSARWGSPARMLRIAVELFPMRFDSRSDDYWERQAREAWMACAVLAAHLDLPLVLAGHSEPAARCREFLGWSPGEWPVGGKVPAASEFAPSQALLGAPPAVLSQIGACIDLVRGALLTRDEFLAAGFEWLAERSKADAWWQDFWSLSKIESEVFSSPGVHAYLMSRKPTGGTEDVAFVPELTLRAALVLASSSGEETPTVKQARRALVSASAFAPRLVTFDLALSAILVRWHPPESPCSTH